MNSNDGFNMEEFMNQEELPSQEEIHEEESFEEAPELDVQKAVVESLAADKAILNGEIEEIKKKILEKDTEIRILQGSISAKDASISSLSRKLAEKEEEIKFKNEEIARIKSKEIDTQERNPNALALLDRDVELPDRFPGETRDHVLEVLKEARDKAEKEGKIRRAQVLEGVLVANEPNGNLASRRSEIIRLFEENNNILSGFVISELKKRSIPFKNGEEYLLPSEIIKRNF